MHRPVMPATERDRELIADLAAECAGLGEAQVVGIRGLAAAHETCLLGDIAQVLPVAIAPRGCKDEHALVVSGGGITIKPPPPAHLLPTPDGGGPSLPRGGAPGRPTRPPLVKRSFQPGPLGQRPPGFCRRP